MYDEESGFADDGFSGFDDKAVRRGIHLLSLGLQLM